MILNEESLQFIIAPRDICESCQGFSGPKFMLFELRDASDLHRKNIILTDPEQILSKSNIASVEEEIQLLDTEIARLQLSLDALNDRRTQLQEFVHTERALVSPIRKLPIELLVKIFYHAQELTKSDFRSAFVQVAIRVSMYWRTVAHSYGDLWAHVEVAPYMEAYKLKEYGLKPFLRKCLSLSNNAPLTIRLPEQCNEEVLGNNCIREIGENAHRWKNISIYWKHFRQIYTYVPKDVIFSCLVELKLRGASASTHIVLYPTPLLRNLSLESVRDNESQITFQSAPALTHVHLWHVKYPMTCFNNLPWSQIIHFTSMNGACAEGELSNILVNAPHLEMLYLDEDINPRQPIVLPKLEVLVELNGIMGRETNALDVILAPSLKELTLKRYYRPSCVIEFLRKSQCSLERLELPARIIDESWLMATELSGVKELHLHLLSFPNVLEWLTDVDSTGQWTLFPHLESLNIIESQLGAVIQAEDDSVIMSMIKVVRSRIWPVLLKKESSSLEYIKLYTKPLKFVEIHFDCRPGGMITNSEELKAFLVSEEVLDSKVTIQITDYEGVLVLFTP